MTLVPDAEPVPGPAAPPLPVWHPPHATLELIEMVVAGALAEPPAGLLPSGAATVEDAEGTPVAALAADGSLSPLRPFTHPPLRAHRRTPAQVRAVLAAAGNLPVLAVPVPRALTTDQVERIRARAGGVRLLWLVLVPDDRPDSTGPAGARRLSPHALLRAVRSLGHDLGGAVVPVALPAARHDLLEQVSHGYGADHVLALPDSSSQAELAPEFVTELARATRSRPRRGLVLFFTGLSGSGKSTLARALAERVLDDGERTLTMLDGDQVRRMLSAGLTFSRADREANIRRIGYVAAEIARHGGMAVAAPIAPFAAGRAEVRELVARADGDFVLIHVATPLAECERRDRKGLYAAARRGEVAEFTGISSPYEEPIDADLVLDTTALPLEQCLEEIWQLLARRGLLDGGPAGSRDGAG
jgi:sulfate adenylyltransferase